MLDWGIEENNLVLYPDFMHNWLQRECSFNRLIPNSVTRRGHLPKTPHLLFLCRTLVCSTLVRDISQKWLAAPVCLFGTIKL